MVRPEQRRLVAIMTLDVVGLALFWRQPGSPKGQTDGTDPDVRTANLAICLCFSVR